MVRYSPNSGITGLLKDITKKKEIGEWQITGNVYIAGMETYNANNFVTIITPWINTLRSRDNNIQPNNVLNKHEAMNTSAAKHLFYYLSSLQETNVFNLKDGISSKDIIAKTLQLNSVMYQYATDKKYSDSYTAYNIAKAEGLTAFDLETLGDDTITDFHFEKIGAGGYDPNSRTYFSSALGISKDQKNQYLDIINKWEISGENSLSQEERVTLERLNRIGSADTKLSVTDSEKALFRYETLGEHKNFSKDRMIAGVERLFDIGEKQAATSVEGVRPVIQEMIEGVTSSRVLGGHNISGFDMPKLHSFFTARNKDGILVNVSEQEYKLYQNKLELKRPKLLDTMILARIAEAKKAMGTIAQEMRDPAYKKYGALRNSQSGLIIRGGRQDLLQGAHLHAAEHDTRLWMKGIYQSAFFQEDSEHFFFKDKVERPPRSLVVGSLFASGSGENLSKLNSGFVFMRDGLQGDIRFGSGFTYRQNKGKFVQNTMPAFMTNMNYMLAMIEKVNIADNDDLKKLGLSGKTMLSASFVPVLPGAKEEYAGLQDSIVTILAESQEELEDQISNLVYIGQKDEVANAWKDPKNALERIRKAASEGIKEGDIVKFDIEPPEYKKEVDFFDPGSGKKQEYAVHSSLNKRTVESIEVNRPARKVRDLSMSFMSKYWKYAEQMAERISKGLSAQLPHEALIQLFEYEVDGQEGKYFQSNSIRNFMFAKEYVKIFDPIAIAAAKASKTEKDFTYIYTHMLGNIMAKAGIQNLHPQEVRDLTTDEIQTVDIDLSRFADRNNRISKIQRSLADVDRSDILTIKTGKLDHGLTDRYLKIVLGDNIENISPTDRVKSLLRLMENINESRGAKIFSKSELEEFKARSSDINETELIATISDRLEQWTQGEESKKDGQKRHLYTRTKQSLDASKSEFVIEEKPVVLIGENGNYTFNEDVYGSLDDYAQNAINDYKLQIEKEHLTADQKINTLIDDVLFGQSKIKEEDLIKFGYTEEQARELVRQRELRKRDTRSLIGKTLGLIERKDPRATVDIDIKTGQVRIITQDEKIVDVSHLLPYDVYDQKAGRFYVRLGNMNVVNPVSLVGGTKYGTKNLSFTYGTALGQAIFDNGYLTHTVERGIKDGTAVDKMVWGLQNVAAHMRTSPLGPGTSAYADMRTLAKYVPQLVEQGIITTAHVDQSLIDAVRKNKGKQVSFSEKISVEMYEALWSNMRGVIRAIADNGKAAGILDSNKDDIKSLKDLANVINISTKPSIHGFADTITTENYDSPSPRYIDTVRQRSVIFDPNSIDNEFVDAPDDVKKMVKNTDHLIRTRLEANRQALQDGKRTSIVGRRLNIGHKAFFDKYKDKIESLSPQARMLLERSLYTAEGGGIINPYLVDTIFSQQHSDQKINVADIAEMKRLSPADIKEEKSRRFKHGYTLKYDEASGEYRFRYGMGQYVQTNDVIAITYDNFSGSTKSEKAKHAGIVKTIFFDRDEQKAVSERDINTYIRLWQKGNPKATETDIVEELKRKYREKLVNTSFEVNSYAKYLENEAEKGMRLAPIAGLGTVDAKVDQFFADLKLNKLRGKGLAIDSIEWLFGDDNYGNLKHFSDKTLEPSEIKAKVKELFGDKEGLLAAIRRERYSLWNEISENVLGRSDIAIISNNAADALKHGDFRGAFNYAFAQIEGLENESTRNALVKRINNDGIFGEGNELSYNKEEGFILSHAAQEVQVNKLYKAVQDVTGQELSKDVQNYFSGKSFESFEDNVNLSQLEDHEKSSYWTTEKGFKYTKRDADNMIASIYDKESLSSVRERVAKATGDRAFADSIFAGSPEKGVVQHQMLLNFKHRIYAQDYNNLVMKDGEIQSKRLAAFARGKGIDEDYLKKILTGLKGAKDVDVNYLEKAYVADMYSLSKDYNSETGRISDRILRSNHNFHEVKIENAVTSRGMNEYLENSIFGKNLLIDLGSVKGLATSKGHSKIAIPYLAANFMAEDFEGSNPILDTVRSLNAHAKNWLESDSEKEKAKLFGIMQEQVGKIEQHLTALGGKNGVFSDLDSSRLVYSSSSSKEEYISLVQQSDAPWKFRGKSIVDMAKGGVELKAAFISQSRLEEMLGDSFFKQIEQLGISKEDYFKHVEEHGIVGFANRKPSGYMESLTSARIYLDRSMTGHQTKVTESLGFIQHGDLDGDILGVGIVTSKGKTTQGNLVHIDSATQEILSARGSTGSGMQLAKGILAQAKHEFKGIDDATLFMSAHSGNIFMEGVAAAERKAMAEATEATNDILRGFMINGTYYAPVYGERREFLEKTWTSLGQHDDFRDIMSKRDNTELLDFKSQVEEQINKIFGAGSAEAKQYEEALGYHMNEIFAQKVTEAGAGKQGTGLVNFHAQKYRSLMSMMIQTGESQLSSRQVGIIQSSLITLEDKFFASKNAQQSMSEALEKFGSVTNNLLGKGQTDPTALIDFMLNDFNIVNEKWMQKSFGENGISEEEFRAAWEAFIPKGREFNQNVFEAINTGMGSGKDSKMTLFTDTKYHAGTLYFKSALGRMPGNIEMVTSVFRDTGPDAFESATAFEIPVSIQATEAKASLMESIKNIKIGKGGGLSRSAVGIAGSIMLAGFIGGNPSRDEDEIAMQNQMAHQQAQVQQMAPNLSAYNQQQFNSAGYQGYTINVKASSPYNSRQGTAAVRQSFTENIHSNVNMNMNINNRNQGPQQRDFMDYFERAI